MSPQETASALARTLIAQRDVKRVKLAAKLGMSPQALSSKLSNSRPWHLDEISAMSKLFEVPVAAFFGDAAAVSEALQRGMAGASIDHFQFLTTAAA
jgi:hypothetical protein